MAVKELRTSRMCYNGEELSEEFDGWQIDERVRWMLTATTLAAWLGPKGPIDQVLAGHNSKYLLPHELTLNEHLRRNRQTPLIHRISLARESLKSVDAYVPNLPPMNAALHLRIIDQTHGQVRLCEDVDNPELLDEAVNE